MLARRAARGGGLLGRRGRDSRRWRRGLWAARRCRGKVWAGALAWARAVAKGQGVVRARARTWAKVLAHGRALACWAAVCRPRGEALGACLLVWQRAFRLAFPLPWAPGVMLRPRWALRLMRRLR